VGIPGSGGQLLILLLFVLPGSVYQTVRTRLRGPIPSDQDATSKVLRALAVRTGLNALYLAIFGKGLLEPLRAQSLPGLEKAVDLHLVGLWALLCLFVVPALLACAVFWSSRSEVIGTTAEKVIQTFGWTKPAYHPSPRTWDFAFTDIRPCYVRVLSADGYWSGGWFGESSSAASFPESMEIFLEKAWTMSKTGEFLHEQPGTRGIYVRCDDARSVELLDGLDPMDDGVGESPASTGK
jgi:hypothetical protein